MDGIVNEVFVLIDENNVVIQAIEVPFDATVDQNGVFNEQVGAQYCQQFAEGTWLWNDKNGGQRKNWAGIGFTYHPDLDAFVPPRPLVEGVSFDSESCQWLINGMTVVEYIKSTRKT